MNASLPVLAEAQIHHRAVFHQDLHDFLLPGARRQGILSAPRLVGDVRVGAEPEKEAEPGGIRKVDFVLNRDAAAVFVEMLPKQVEAGRSVVFNRVVRCFPVVGIGARVEQQLG